MIQAVEVRTPARLHLGMMSFGVPGARSYGGVGVMIDRPGMHLRVRRAMRFEASGPLGDRAVGFATECARAWGLADAACRIEVLAAPRGHVGLGSGTQLGLAVAAAVRHLFVRGAEHSEPAAAHPTEQQLEPVDHDWLFDTHEVLELARAVGRGRRSCVGLYGFSRGGLIVEAGRHADPPTGGSQPPTSGFSPMVARVRLPAAWRCVVIVAREAAGLHGDAEKEAFTALPPVPADVSGELARIALLELLPSAVEGRFGEFTQAVRRYGLLAGRPFEPLAQKMPHAEATARLLELLAELGHPGSAQSSWGPAVMACCESLEAAGTLVETLDALGLGSHHEICIARFDTQGATLRVVG